VISKPTTQIINPNATRSNNASLREPIIAVTEYSPKLKPEQDLRAKDQHTRLVQGYFDLF
jgi:hypothetical protein